MSTATSVFLYALLTALATGLGAVPFAFIGAVSPRATAYANATAAGLMLGASLALVTAGPNRGSWQSMAGALVGVVLMLAIQRLLAGHEIPFGGRRGAGAQKAVLMVVVMTARALDSRSHRTCPLSRSA